MGKIDKIIDKLCPNGVKHEKIGNLITVEKGKQLNKNQLLEKGNYPVINGGINPSGYWNEFNYDENLITISQGGASAGYVNFIKTKFWAGAHCYVVTKVSEKVNYRYIYHFIKSKEKELQNSQVGAGIPSVSLKEINNLIIAVPPLEVQDEIVRVLDDFTLLSAELLAELKARKKQYEYYKNKLFDFDNKVEMIKFGDLCDVLTKQTGFDYSKTIKDSLNRVKTENSMPYIQTKFFVGKNFEYNTDYYIPDNIAKQFPKIVLDRKSILLSIVGASIGNIGLFNGEVKCFLGGAICVAKVSKKYNIDYIYYYLTSYFGQKQIFNKVKGAGQATVTIEDIRKFNIPMPTTDVQDRIVEILSRLDMITNDISEGLPAEIGARQKQYEYYRDKLLTFKELVNEG